MPSTSNIECSLDNFVKLDSADLTLTLTFKFFYAVYGDASILYAQSVVFVHVVLSVYFEWTMSIRVRLVWFSLSKHAIISFAILRINIFSDR